MTTIRTAGRGLVFLGLGSIYLASAIGAALQRGAQAEATSAAGSRVPSVKASTKETDDPKQLQLFESYIRDNRLEEVEPLLVKYLEKHPKSSMAYYQLGYAQFRAHKIGACIKSLAKSLELNIKNAEAHKILGLALTIISRYDEAQIELEQAAHLKPESAEIRYFLGRIYYTRNAFPLAKREFEAAIRLDASYMKSYDNLGLTLEGMGDDQGAIAHYRKAIELGQKQGLKYEWPYINLCTYYNRQNMAEPALENCRKALELNPDSFQAYFELGKAYMAQQNWEMAAKALERAIALNPRAPRFRFVLSTVYRKLGRMEESRKEMAAFQQLSAQALEMARPQGGDRGLRSAEILEEEAR